MTSADASYSFDILAFRDLSAQASLVMDDDKTSSAPLLATDNTAPEITLLGSSNICSDCGEVFVDPGGRRVTPCLFRHQPVCHKPEPEPHRRESR